MFHVERHFVGLHKAQAVILNRRLYKMTGISREIVPRGTAKTDARLVGHNREVKSMKKRSTSSRNSGKSSRSSRSSGSKKTGSRRSSKRGGKRS